MVSCTCITTIESPPYIDATLCFPKQVLLNEDSKTFMWGYLVNLSSIDVQLYICSALVLSRLIFRPKSLHYLVIRSSVSWAFTSLALLLDINCRSSAYASKWMSDGRLERLERSVRRGGYWIEMDWGYHPEEFHRYELVYFTSIHWTKMPEMPLEMSKLVITCWLAISKVFF